MERRASRRPDLPRDYKRANPSGTTAASSVGTRYDRGENPPAYQLYLRGLYHREKWTAEGMKVARDYYQQAIKLDLAERLLSSLGAHADHERVLSKALQARKASHSPRHSLGDRTALSRR